jgi:FO synthase subunit 1
MIRPVAVTKILFQNEECRSLLLNRSTAQIFLLAGADDWGGVSPLTKDYVNPESPWPEMDELILLTEEMGFQLEERLPVYQKYIKEDFLSHTILKKIS